MRIKVKFLFFDQKLRLFSDQKAEAPFNLKPLEKDPETTEDGDLWVIRENGGLFIRYQLEGTIYQTPLQVKK